MINFSPSNAALALRQECDSDREFLRGLYASTRREEMTASGWNANQIDAFLAEQFRLQSQHYATTFTDAEFWILEHRGQPIGRLYLDERDDEFRVIDIALVPESRGLGLGGQLLKDLQAFAEARNKCIRIHVEQNNPAMSLYRRLGFEPLEEHGIYLLMEWCALELNPANSQ